MSDKITKSPQIRFAGFTDAWERRKLEEISEKVTEKNKNNIYSETLTNSAEFGIINQRDFFDKDISNEKNIDGYYVVRPDDFVYNPRISNLAPVGPIKRNKLGRTGVMSPLYYVFRTHNVDKTYLEKYFSTSSWHIFMKLNGDSGARSDRFAIKDSVFREMPIPIPSIKEQNKIGNFFDQLDNLITLHKRKLELLKDTKKSLLQKMFPKDGANVPEIRFAGFTDVWEQRRLGDCAIIKGRLGWKSLKQEEYTKEGPSMIAGKHITDGQIDWCKVDHIPQWRYDESPEIMLKNGDVIFSKDGSLGNPAIIEDLRGLATINSTMMLVRVDKTINPKFFYQVMKSSQFERLIYLKVSGSSIPHLFQADMNEFSFFAPSIGEQTRIGEFFKELDHLITLHQRELNSVENFKKSLLQQMFV